VIGRLFSVGALLLLLSAPAGANEGLNVSITVLPVSPAKIHIVLESDQARDLWSFRNSYGPVIGLTERIGNFEGVDRAGNAVEIRKVAPGEFRVPAAIRRVAYDVNLSPPPRLGDWSHVSWISGERGLLMLADLLPLAASSDPISVRLKLPDEWKVSSEAKFSNGYFQVAEPDKTVFMIGSSIRNQNRQVESQDLAVVISGQWSFSDGDLAKIAGRLLKNYSRLTGFKLQRGARVLLLPLPAGAGADRWTAETRGNTVVLLIGAQASKRQLLGRLGVILTHEMFHLWIPNALSLKGDYDWFFEGFTLYQALRTAQEIGLIDFNEYLNTLGRVYDSYLLAMDGDRLSLLELSERRWTSSSSLVYDKGMLVAFLYDLELQSRSRGKTDFAAIYQQLFSADYSTFRDANEAVIAVLNRPDGMEQFSTKYIERPARINLKELLLPYGINVERVEFRTRLTVAADASDWQLVLLNALGYKK
jgi:hypothetical protein